MHSSTEGILDINDQVLSFISSPRSSAWLVDDDFLSEVDDFLDSCNLPSLQELDKTNGDSSVRDRTRRRGKKKQTTGIVDNKKEERVRHCAYRVRRQNEREKLEQEVKEFTGKLHREPARIMALAGWRMVARRHLEERLVSEAQQRQLHAAGSAQDALIQEFRELIADQFVKEKNGDWNQDPHRHNKLRLEPFDTEMFETYAKYLDVVYSQTDELFDELEMSKVPWDQTWREDKQKGYFQYTDKQMLPFDFKQTCESRWQAALLLRCEEDRQLFDGIKGS